MSTAKLVRIVCGCCGSEWYVSSVREYARQVEEMWRPWEKCMTPDQKELVAEKNDPARLEQILRAEGRIKSICDRCRLELTLMALYG